MTAIEEIASATPDAREPRSADEAQFLTRLGQRVRHVRALRGMSRKVLARVSGISERYIAQLEGGNGNVSVTLLRRIALAMGAELDTLLAEDETHAGEWRLLKEMLGRASPDRVRELKALLAGVPSEREPAAGAAGRIALIGLRGAGKSTLGRIVAAERGCPFVELNAEIEGATGLSVNEIFAIYGQDGYRKFEQEAVRRIAARAGPMIVATGGGIVAEPATYELLLSSFFTVWLRAAPEEHMARVRAQGDLRPMADDRAAMQELRAILSSREPLYGRADATVDTSGVPAEEAASRLGAAVRAGAIA